MDHTLFNVQQCSFRYVTILHLLQNLLLINCYLIVLGIFKDEGVLPDESFCGLGSSLLENRIFHGDETESGEFPWMVFLTKYTASKEDPSTYVRTYCGGTILNKKYIMTAAHCIIQNKTELIDPSQ